MNSQTQKGKESPVGWWFVGFLIFLFFIGLSVLLTLWNLGKSNEAEFIRLGPWGDYFGGTLNPILTFFTFTGVLITIGLQKIELNLSRNESRRAADALEAQIEAIKKQNFESTFFQMLMLHNNIVNAMDLVNTLTEERVHGRDCFRWFLDRLKKQYEQHMKIKNIGDDEALRLAYERFWEKSQLDLGHYYRFLFNTIRFVKENSMEEGIYIKLVRAQLSDQELIILFYNCLSNNGAKFKVFAEDFCLFDNMPDHLLLNVDHKNRFSRTAFATDT